jgi:Na+-transporting methylmalonyl-CoA/oxaloacetate decarboxylase gamma subunit
MLQALDGVARYLPTVLIVLSVLVVVWQIVGWWIVVTCMRSGRAARTDVSKAQRQSSAEGQGLGAAATRDLAR